MAASTAESMGLQSHQPKQEEEANYSQDMQNSPHLQVMMSYFFITNFIIA